MTVRSAKRAPRRAAPVAESRSDAAAEPQEQSGASSARPRSRTRKGSTFSGGGVDDLALASLLASRICHDLANPIGAIYNGVEVIESGDPGREDFIDMICANVRLTRGRLEFLRAAFGVSSGREGGMQTAEIRSLADGMFDAAKFRLEWSLEEQVLTLPETRLLLNQILIAAEALTRGGRLQIGALRREKLQLVVIADGPRLLFDEPDEAMLLRGELSIGAPLAPKKAPILLTHRLARQLGAEPTYANEATEFVLAYAI